MQDDEKATKMDICIPQNPCEEATLSHNLFQIEFSKKLNEIKDNHKIWSNPLLEACKIGTLTFADFQLFFSQYYFYSKNFTKLLAAAMLNSDNDYFRSKLSANLWEEGGGQDIKLRHTEIFRKFLREQLQISIENIHFESYSKYFFKQYLDLCLKSSPAECAAILAFGTEGIVPRWYTIIKNGLLNLGLTEDVLEFFNIHIVCDDMHTQTLEEITLSYSKKDYWLDRCKKAITKALDLRDEFFSNIYNDIKSNKFTELLEKIAHPINTVENKLTPIKALKSSININNDQLYRNQDLEKNINFSVERVSFNADVLDPRIVHIPSGFNNELHSHAHETVFFIIDGMGEVVVDGVAIPVKHGDIVYVPRWALHQTRNTGKTELKFFAVTDYGLTKRLPQNTEFGYRQKNS